MYKSIEPWGIIKYFKTGNFRFAIYSYNDEPDIIYLANVKTRLLSRNKGFGNAILEYVDSLNKTIQEIISNDNIEKMGQNASKVIVKNVEEKIYDCIKIK